MKDTIKYVKLGWFKLNKNNIILERSSFYTRSSKSPSASENHILEEVTQEILLDKRLVTNHACINLVINYFCAHSPHVDQCGSHVNGLNAYLDLEGKLKKNIQKMGKETFYFPTTPAFWKVWNVFTIGI